MFGMRNVTENPTEIQQSLININSNICMYVTCDTIDKSDIVYYQFKVT